MSRRKQNSDNQNVEQSENQRRRPRSRSTPIACIVCDRVFFDNVSLVLHFECHLKGEISIPRQAGRDLASLPSLGPLSLSLLPYPACSSVERTNEVRRRTAPPNCFRPCSFPVFPNFTTRDASLVSIPPIKSSFDARSNVSRPIHRPVMSHYGPISTSSYPLMYSRSYGSAATPGLQIQRLNAGQVRLSNYRNPRNNQLAKPAPEIIIISDDEVDDHKNADEIDLTLKL